MNLLPSTQLPCALCCLFAALLSQTTAWAAPQVLVADRVSGTRVLRYDADGNYLGVLIDDPVNLDQPAGMALSPDRTRLYVSSQQNNSVVRYDFDGTTASNPAVIIDTASGIAVPTSLTFSLDGQTLYVANLGFAFDGNTVSRFDPNGVSAGADLTGGPATGRTGLAFDPSGNLLVSAFGDASVLKYNSGTQLFEPFLGPDVALVGSGNLLVKGNDLYVAASYFFEPFSGTVLKFDATTGVEATFNPVVAPNDFLGGLALAPDGSGFLLGYLELGMGNGRIEKYAFDGTYLGLFANNSGGDPNAGFFEAASILTIFDTADFDTDGDVDSNDLATWEGAYGNTSAGDADADGDSDGLDFLIWQQQAEIIALDLTAVPEPPSLILVATSLAAFVGIRNKFARI